MTCDVKIKMGKVSVFFYSSRFYLFILFLAYFIYILPCFIRLLPRKSESTKTVPEVSVIIENVYKYQYLDPKLPVDIEEGISKIKNIDLDGFRKDLSSLDFNAIQISNDIEKYEEACQEIGSLHQQTNPFQNIKNKVESIVKGRAQIGTLIPIILVDKSSRFSLIFNSFKNAFLPQSRNRKSEELQPNMNGLHCIHHNKGCFTYWVSYPIWAQRISISYPSYCQYQMISLTISFILDDGIVYQSELIRVENRIAQLYLEKPIKFRQIVVCGSNNNGEKQVCIGNTSVFSEDVFSF